MTALTEIKEIHEKIDVEKEILNTMPKNNGKNIEKYSEKISQLKNEYTELKSEIHEILFQRYQKAVDIKNNDETEKLDTKLDIIEKSLYLLSEEKTQFLTYINSEVTVNKTISGRFSSLEYKFRKGLCVPISKTIKSELDLDMFDITIDETGSRDLGILGLGRVSFIGNNQKLRIIVPKGTFNIRSKIDHVNK